MLHKLLYLFSQLFEFILFIQGIENVSSVTTTFSSAASESLARRAQATAQDPVFQKMKSQFTSDFDFT